MQTNASLQVLIKHPAPSLRPVIPVFRILSARYYRKLPVTTLYE